MISMACIMYEVSNVNENEQTRIGYLRALGFSMSLFIGQMMHHLAKFEPIILIIVVLYIAIMYLILHHNILFIKEKILVL
jgi:uncharacterized membrane protein YgaE (UPF0421/DUF939 family)